MIAVAWVLMVSFCNLFGLPVVFWILGLVCFDLSTRDCGCLLFWIWRFGGLMVSDLGFGIGNIVEFGFVFWFLGVLVLGFGLFVFCLSWVGLMCLVLIVLVCVFRLLVVLLVVNCFWSLCFCLVYLV